MSTMQQEAFDGPGFTPVSQPEVLSPEKIADMTAFIGENAVSINEYPTRLSEVSEQAQDQGHASFVPYDDLDHPRRSQQAANAQRAASQLRWQRHIRGPVAREGQADSLPVYQQPVVLSEGQREVARNGGTAVQNILDGMALEAAGDDVHEIARLRARQEHRNSRQ
jgi:hypothetical protein